MRLSLFTRLLTLSLTVAVAAVAGTTWVVSRTTSERVAGEFSRSLEADAFIYTRVLEHAMAHEDWSTVQPLLEELARRTGRRVALASPDGLPLGDTAGADGTKTLPSVPAALIDPFAPLDGVAGTSTPADAAGSGSMFVLDIYAPFDLETADIRAEREGAAAAVEACVEEAGHDATIIDAASRRPRVSERDLLPTEVSEQCGVYDLGVRPTPTEERIHGAVQGAARQCVDEAGLDADAALFALAAIERLQGVNGGHRVPVPEPVAVEEALGPAGTGPRLATEEVVVDCLAAAYQQAYAPYVADPALLYIDDPTEDSIVTAAGGNRMLGAIGLVLAVVTAVTVVAGRRLVRPIRDLTSAAQRMGDGDRSARVRVSGRDDVARLGAAFNAMATSVASEEQQRRAMVSDIAHELRTPLTTLRGYLEAAQDGVVAFDDDLVASLLDESVLVQRLVEDLQQLALADAGRLELHPAQVDPGELAEQVGHAHQRQAARRHIDLTVEHRTATPPLTADPARLRQALGNLVDNAVRHTAADGRVRIVVDHDGDAVTFAVADTGEGIARHHLPHVFDRFYRADTSRSRETGGSGLGLAITRTLVEAHGGDVTASSGLGEGSTFTIRLPVGRDELGPKQDGLLPQQEAVPRWRAGRDSNPRPLDP